MARIPPTSQYERVFLEATICQRGNNGQGQRLAQDKPATALQVNPNPVKDAFVLDYNLPEAIDVEIAITAWGSDCL